MALEAIDRERQFRLLDSIKIDDWFGVSRVNEVARAFDALRTSLIDRSSGLIADRDDRAERRK